MAMAKYYKGVRLHDTNENINRNIKKAMDTSEGRMDKDPYKSGFVDVKYVTDFKYLKK